MSHDELDHEPPDETLRASAASGYNAPGGVVPREEMWARISAARHAARALPATAQPVRSEPTTIVPLRATRPAPWRWGVALAAGIALGILLDRAVVERDGPPSGARVAVTQPDARPAGTLPAGTTPPPSAAEGSGAAAPPSLPRVADRRGGGSMDPLRPAGPRGAGSDEPSVAGMEPGAEAPRNLYQAAALQTLVQAEALLTAYRRDSAGAGDPQAMQQAARWARDVLSSTRLLMDSPASQDPRMRALFTDLELVLAQIVQLSGAPLQADERAAIERALIERSMRDRDLLPRLRSAVPAGLSTT